MATTFLLIISDWNMLTMKGLVQSIAFVMSFGMVPVTQFQIFDPSGIVSQSRSHMCKRLFLCFELGSIWAVDCKKKRVEDEIK